MKRSWLIERGHLFDQEAFYVSGKIRKAYNTADYRIRSVNTIDAVTLGRILEMAISADKSLRGDILEKVAFCRVDFEIETIFLIAPDLAAKRYLDQKAVSGRILTEIHRENEYLRHLVFVLRGDKAFDDNVYDAGSLANKEVPFLDNILESVRYDGSVNACADAFRAMSEYGIRFLVTEGYSDIARSLTKLLQRHKSEPASYGRCTVISGPTQSGKTHLLVTVGRAMKMYEERPVIYYDFRVLANKAAQLRKEGVKCDYLMFKKQFAGSHLLLDDVCEYKTRDTEGVYDLVRTVLYSGGRVMVTVRSEEDKEHFLDDVKNFYPEINPLLIDLPVPSPEHSASVMRRKLSYASMIVNEKQFHAIRGIADSGSIPHSFQLGEALERIKESDEVSFGQLAFWCSGDPGANVPGFTLDEYWEIQVKQYKDYLRNCEDREDFPF